MSSLKGRLFLILVAATSLIWLAATCWIYVGATREIESVLDARLQEAARMVLSLASHNGVAAVQADGYSASAPEIMSYERQLSCQIWSLDGRLVARSSGAPDESLSDRRAGFSQRLIKGETWRVYTAEDAARGVRVSVGDRLGLRAHLVGEIIKGLLAPLLLAIPLLGLLIWASLARGLRPLQALARELARRNADDMRPVETGTIPAEIRPVVASLNHLFRKVRDAMQHERELTAFAAHELRTPLAGLRTQAQIAMVASDGTVREAALRQIVVAVDRTTRMVRQLLAMAKLDSIHEAKRTSVSIGEVIQEVIDALPASDRKAQVTVDPALKTTVVTANRELLLVAIRNLHENAARHMPEPGAVRWSLQGGADALAVCVDDEGPGIPEDEIALVTNRFFRGRNKSALGSGLGLSIVDLALRASGARLVLQNRSDAGGLRAQIVWQVVQESEIQPSLTDTRRPGFKRFGPRLSPA
jgi:two-component system, OmpR family, sensor histidine kinase QseC